MRQKRLVDIEGMCTSHCRH